MSASQYDPIPDLAQLIDGLHDTAVSGARGQDAHIEALACLLVGPYARLRGGLLLDEPGWDTPTTEEALREALRDLNQEKRS